MLARCVVCGHEGDVDEIQLLLAGRAVDTGAQIMRQPEHEEVRWQDGALAWACDGHTDDEVVAAQRLHGPALVIP